jgi:hypothetical protein
MQDISDRQSSGFGRASKACDESDAKPLRDAPSSFEPAGEGDPTHGPGRRGSGAGRGGSTPARRKGGKAPSSRRITNALALRATTEVFLSYLTGLGPVGEPIEPRLACAMADLGYRQKVSIYRCLSDLIACGCVRKLAPGSGGTIGLIVVDIRLEEIERGRRAAADDDDAAVEAQPIGAGRVRAGRVTPQDWAARIAEIPDDKRSLTARVFGDPIPGDQRRRRITQPRPRSVSLHRTAPVPAEDQPPSARRA